MKSKEELSKAAPGYFKDYPKEDVLYATADGNFFIGKNKSSAESHAKSKGFEKPVRFDREDFDSADQDAAEAKRLANEKAAQDAAEVKRLADEKAAQDAAEVKRLADEKADQDAAEVKRLADEKAANEKNVTLPEGVPTKDWTKDQLIAYGEANYPDLKLTKTMKEDTLLGKLEEAAKAAEQGAGE